MATFDNLNALKTELNSRLKKAIDILSEKIYNQLKINISLYTYGYPVAMPDIKGPINQFYENVGDEGSGEPSFEFRDLAWVKTSAKEISNQIIGSIYYDGNKMSAPSWLRPYTHGNFYTGEDRRAELAKLLNVTGYADGSDFTIKGEFEEKFRKPFFDITIQWLETNWNNLAKDALKQVGLNVR